MLRVRNNNTQCKLLCDRIDQERKNLCSKFAFRRAVLLPIERCRCRTPWTSDGSVSESE